MFDCSQISIDKNSAEPLHIQLIRELRRLIREMNQEEYDVLPSERHLCTYLNLHRSTVHKAYESLKNSGIVRRQSDKSLFPNISARKRLEGYVPAIGIILPCRFSQYISVHSHALRLLEGIFDRAAERNYAVFLLELPPADISAEERSKFIATRFSGLSGILLLGDRGIDEDVMLTELFNYSGIPQIAICGEVHQPHIGSVKCRFDHATDDMMKFFRSRGIKSVGVVSYTPDHFQHSDFDYSSFHRVAEMKKKLIDQQFILPENWQISVDALETALPGELPDAFWCFNDQIALQLWNTLKKHDLETDVMICGFDGAVNIPCIATIKQPYQQIGITAVDLLIEHYEYGISLKNRVKYLDAEFVFPAADMQELSILKKSN
ncbi:MAG: substrate-binding domain-containing protein [Lentisphaeria bacterium]|nr:substrate-binding domain-containing protein [Lentisphaeria bacterium]